MFRCVKDALYFKPKERFRVAQPGACHGISSSEAEVDVPYDGHQRGEGYATLDGEVATGILITGRPRSICLSLSIFLPLYDRFLHIREARAKRRKGREPNTESGYFSAQSVLAKRRQVFLCTLLAVTIHQTYLAHGTKARGISGEPCIHRQVVKPEGALGLAAVADGNLDHLGRFTIRCIQEERAASSDSSRGFRRPGRCQREQDGDLRRHSSVAAAHGGNIPVPSTVDGYVLTDGEAQAAGYWRPYSTWPSIGLAKSRRLSQLEKYTFVNIHAKGPRLSERFIGVAVPEDSAKACCTLSSSPPDFGVQDGRKWQFHGIEASPLMETASCATLNATTRTLLASIS